jgi:hypothetical protein
MNQGPRVRRHAEALQAFRSSKLDRPAACRSHSSSHTLPPGMNCYQHTCVAQVDSLEKYHDDGALNYGPTLFVASYIVIVVWVLLQASPNPPGPSPSRFPSISVDTSHAARDPLRFSPLSIPACTPSPPTPPPCLLPIPTCSEPAPEQM